MDREKKTEVLQIRLSPSEKEKMKACAAAAGLSVTGFILMECLGEKIGQIILDGFGREQR